RPTWRRRSPRRHGRRSPAATLGRDVAEAMRIATSGRPGPVHLSLPSDLLEERVESNAIVWPDAREGSPAAPLLTTAVADAALAAIAAAARPIKIGRAHV